MEPENVKEWEAVEANRAQVDHVWKVLRERVLEWELAPQGYFDREGQFRVAAGFRPFSNERDAFELFQYWDDCVQIYKLSAGGDYLATIDASTSQISRSVAKRAPTLAQSMLRGTIAYLAKKRIKWRVG